MVGGELETSWLIGARLADRFVVERRLGEGGMGVVFEALDEQRGERVALKTLGQMDGASVYRLKKEFRALVDLVHPNIIRLHELFSDRGLWFFTMARIDALAMIETMRGLFLASRGLVEALRTGDPSRLPLALWGITVATAAMVHPDNPRIIRWLALADRLALQQPENEASFRGVGPYSEGFIAFIGGRWRKAYERCHEAETLLERCPGRPAELSNARALTTWAQFYLGELNGYSERTGLFAREARARGNLWSLNAMVNTWGPVVHLARDDIAAAERESSEAFASWPGKNFQLQNYWHMLARACIDLYADEGKRLHAHLESEWPALRGSRLLHGGLIRYQLFHIRAAACLAAATKHPDGRRRDDLLRSAERHAREVIATPIMGSGALAALINAGVADSRRDPALARQHLAAAVEDFERAEMRLYAAAARRHLGRLRGGDEGAKLVEEADSFMRGQGVVKPEQFARMFAPGFSA